MTSPYPGSGPQPDNGDQPAQYVAPPTESHPPVDYPPPPGQYSQPPPDYGPPPAQYGPPPGQYNQPPPDYGPPPAQYGPPPGQYNQPPAQYGQPPAQYGQPPPAQYGQPPADYAPYGQQMINSPIPGYVPGTATVGGQRAFGVVGTVIALIGAAAVVLSFTALNWLTGTDAAGSSTSLTFKNLHDLSRAIGNSGSFVPRHYFDWLGWALLAAVVVLALLANAPTPVHPLFRFLGFAGGIGAAVVTFFALKSGGIGLHDLVKHASAGFWVAIAGFVVAAFGAAIGPRRVRQ